MQINLWQFPWSWQRQTRDGGGSLCQVSLSLTVRGCILTYHCCKSLITILYNYKLSNEAIIKLQTFCVYDSTCSPSPPVTLTLANKFPVILHSPQILTCLPSRKTWSGNPVEVSTQIRHVCLNPKRLLHLITEQKTVLAGRQARSLYEGLQPKTGKGSAIERAEGQEVTLVRQGRGRDFKEEMYSFFQLIYPMKVQTI